MAVMISTPLDKPPGEPFTAADLELMPDDGRRYEIIDGTLIVSAAPNLAHQRVLAALHLLLHDACTPDLEVLFAPFDVALTIDTVLEPDMLVARRSDLTAKNLPAPPVLAVEVLSPSTRLFDLNTKSARFARAGCPSYWTIDPEGPHLIARVLRDGEYVVTADLTGDEVFETELPYPVSFRISDLLDQ